MFWWDSLLIAWMNDYDDEFSIFRLNGPKVIWPQTRLPLSVVITPTWSLYFQQSGKAIQGNIRTNLNRKIEICWMLLKLHLIDSLDTKNTIFFWKFCKNVCNLRSFAQSKFFTKTSITCAPCNRFSSNRARLKGLENLHLFIAVCYNFFFVNFIAHAVKVFKPNLRSWRPNFFAQFFHLRKVCSIS